MAVKSTGWINTTAAATIATLLIAGSAFGASVGVGVGGVGVSASAGGVGVGASAGGAGVGVGASTGSSGVGASAGATAAGASAGVGVGAGRYRSECERGDEHQQWRWGNSGSWGKLVHRCRRDRQRYRHWSVCDKRRDRSNRWRWRSQQREYFIASGHFRRGRSRAPARPGRQPLAFDAETTLPEYLGAFRPIRC